MDVGQAGIGELGRAMQRYQRAVQAFDDAVGRALELGPSDLRCLDWLVDGPLTAGQLSRASGIRPAATTALIDRLERRGFVARESDPSNRRQVLVSLTEFGRVQVDRCYGPLVAEGFSLMADLGEDDIEVMRQLLDTITALTNRHRERLAPQG